MVPAGEAKGVYAVAANPGPVVAGPAWDRSYATSYQRPVDFGVPPEASYRTYPSQTLAIQGPGVIASIWPDWVILPYFIGAELTVE